MITIYSGGGSLYYYPTLKAINALSLVVVDINGPLGRGDLCLINFSI